METLGNNRLSVVAMIEGAEHLLKDTQWTLEYWNTGGGVMCILAFHPDMPPVDDKYTDELSRVYFGDGSGDIGWSDEFGEKYGDFEFQTTSGEISVQIAELLKAWKF